MAFRTSVPVSVTLAILCASFAHAITGQPGTLDPFWATGSPLGAGKVITPIGTGTESANALVLQPDGKVVMAGDCANGANRDFCALRYNANGTLDASFGSGGTVITPVGTSGDFATAIALQPDGKLVLAGYCGNGANTAFCALRYNANGTLDTSFGSSGNVITPVGAGNDTVSALALQPDGKLVLAGYCANGANRDFCALRYNANGTLDASFGNNGTVVTPVGTGDDSAYALALQPDGKLLLAGDCLSSTSYVFCALRYNANGTLDASFGSSGKVITSGGGLNSFAKALAIQPDGKLLLSGYCANATTIYFCAARVNGNGTLDTSFGSGGTVGTTIGPYEDYATALALQPDGKLLLAGYCSADSGLFDFCALRYNASGVLDTTFGTNGKVTTSISSGNDYATGLALQPDGKLLLAGYCSYDFCALRYDGGPFGYQNCKPDLDGDGLMTATVDGLINMRVMLGMTGNAVVNGITFPPTATRNTWPLIRDYLVTQCGMSLLQ